MKLRMEPLSKDTIPIAATEAIRVANRLGIAVVFTFNGTEMTIHPGAVCESVIDRYYRLEE